jgi:hypothetical protein
VCEPSIKRNNILKRKLGTKVKEAKLFILTHLFPTYTKSVELLILGKVALMHVHRKRNLLKVYGKKKFWEGLIAYFP